MGGFYGSIQARTENLDQIVSAVSEVTRAMEIHALIGPPIKGWVGIYPEMSGQDERVGSELAARLDCDLLHAIVHDDDIFAYWLYREHRLVDSFWSLPGYFGEDNRAEQDAMKGDPEIFRPIISNKVSRLIPVLDRSQTGLVFASERLQQFAKVLGIQNAVTSYEYLKGGEREGVRGWRQFQEVPADQVQSQAETRRQSKARLKSERQTLKSEGVLLYSDHRKLATPCVCATEQGLIVGWTDCRTEVVFEELSAPWKAARSLDLLSQSHLVGVVSDHSGRRIAMTASDRIRVYDNTGTCWQHVVDIPESDHAIGIAISADGQIVYHLSRIEIVATEVRSNRRVATIDTQGTSGHGTTFIACHPTENWLATRGNSFGFVWCGDSPSWREIFVGGKLASDPAALGLLASQLGDFDPTLFERQQRDAIEQAVQQLRAMAKSSKIVMDEDAIHKMKLQMEASIETMQARFAQFKSGSLPVTARSKEAVRFSGFSRNGEFLWCATDRGVRVYRWDQINRDAGSELPPPQWKFDCLPTDSTIQPFGEMIGVIAESVHERAIVFGGSQGRLYQMNLTTGDVRELIKFPGNYWIYSAVFSRDGDVLAISARLSPDSEDPYEQQKAQIVCDLWSYDQLVKNALRAI